MEHWRQIALIGLGQIISWGTLYYGLAILAQPILADSLWPEWVVYGAFSLGLMLWGLGQPVVGRWIDAHGGRRAMSVGSLLGALAFSILAMAETPMLYALGWLVAGISMALTLYDAAFAIIHRLDSQHYRRNIALLTFIGGFSSTAFWPLSFYLQQNLGWRETYWVYALLHLSLAPLHWWVLSGSLPEKHVNDTSDIAKLDSSRNRIRGLPGKSLIVSTFSLATIVFAALSLFIVDALSLKGISTEQAIWLAALIGPMQVAGRILERLFGYRFSVYQVGLVCMLALVVAMLALNLADLDWWFGLTFVLLYGVANGVMTLVRGALPVELYGPEQVGGLLGHLAKPVLFAKALTPGALALVLSAGLGLEVILWTLLLVTLLALISYWQLNRYTAGIAIDRA